MRNASGVGIDGYMAEETGEQNEHLTKNKFTEITDKLDMAIDKSDSLQKFMFLGIIAVCFFLGVLAGIFLMSIFYDSYVLQPLRERIESLNNLLDKCETGNSTSPFLEGPSSILQ